MHELYSLSMIWRIYMKYMILRFSLFPSLSSVRYLSLYFNNSHSISKTNQFHVDIEIYLAYSSHSFLCSVIVLRTLFIHYPKSSQFSLFIYSYDQSFSKSFLVLKMRELVLNAGISIIDYSEYSLQKEATITTNRNDISRHDIKLLEQ